jgi:hypothetical protein
MRGTVPAHISDANIPVCQAAGDRFAACGKIIMSKEA